MKIGNRKWILIFVAIILICLIFVIVNNHGSPTKAQIYVDGKLVREIEDLYPTDEECFWVETEWGKNEIAVFNGKIRVKSSDCGNQTCVHFGELATQGRSIICAPHKMVIKLVGKDDATVVL